LRILIAGDAVEVFSINRDGTGRTRLTFGLDRGISAWSPDGTKIVFESDDSSALASPPTHLHNELRRLRAVSPEGR
jgi:Tol biopolymer transport system component